MIRDTQEILQLTKKELSEAVTEWLQNRELLAKDKQAKYSDVCALRAKGDHFLEFTIIPKETNANP